MEQWSPSQLREECRKGAFRGVTSGACGGKYEQANLLILEPDVADDFLLFCERNPAPCPLLAVGRSRSVPSTLVPEAASDIATDVPRYRVVRGGEVRECSDVSDVWADGLVTFYLGCSFGLEYALQQAGVPIRNADLGRNVSMYQTNRMCASAGVFPASPLVVSMRPIPLALVELAVQISSRMPRAHGAPVHVGDPGELGIADIRCPDFGDPPDFHPGDVPVFWACGVTSSLAAKAANLSSYMTHSPGCMFVTDLISVPSSVE